MDDGNRLTVYELVERVIPCIIAKHYSENYIQGFRSTFRNLLAYCNKNEKKYFTAELAQQFMLDCYGVQPGTVERRCSRVHRAMDLLSDYQHFNAVMLRRRLNREFPAGLQEGCGQLLAKAISPRTQGEYAAQPQKCSSSLYRLFVQRWSHGLQITFSRYCKSIRQSCFVQLQQFGCKAPLQYPFTLFSVPCA